MERVNFHLLEEKWQKNWNKKVLPQLKEIAFYKYKNSILKNKIYKQPLEIMIFCFDIDNTICTTKRKDYKSAKPKKNVINLINELYDSGHTIKIFTSRYMGRNKDNEKLVRRKYYMETKNFLKKWGVKYNHLILGKPSYDVFVDDKAFMFKKNWAKKFKKKYL